MKTDNGYICDVCKNAIYSSIKTQISIRIRDDGKGVWIMDGIWDNYESHICGDCWGTIKRFSLKVQNDTRKF